MNTEPARSPTIAEYEAMEKADPNAWWRLSSGDHENLFDEARDEVERLRTELQTAKAELRKDKQIMDYATTARSNMEATIAALEVRNTELRAERDHWRRLVLDPANVCGESEAE